MQAILLKVEVKRIHRILNARALKAFADIVVNDALLIKGVLVMEGKTGVFVSMPREQSTKDKKWYDTVRCLTHDVKEEIEAKVLEAYARQE